MDRNTLIEIGIYTGIITLGALGYILIVKFGIPWYYCNYHLVCLN